jgi:putative transposase
LRTGIQWKALPKEFGAVSSVHEYFSKWAQAGLFMRLWQEGLLGYDELRGIGWEWQSADGCMVKAPLTRESAGNNPTDRGKKGTRRSLAAEPHGLPVGIAIGEANRHDIKLLEATMQSIVTARPEGNSLCLDEGYAGAQSLAEAMGYAVHIRGRGEERQEKEQNVNFKARRRVVEACHSWLNRFRKLLVRYEKKGSNYLALLFLPPYSPDYNPIEKS